MTTNRRRLTRNEQGVRHLFGKRYLWLLDEEGRLGLHKVDDRGDEESMKALLEKQKEQAE
jgi:hypothetical protein